jgi:DNA-binding transcriptional regulator YdaS (Cro superfamily)
MNKSNPQAVIRACSLVGGKSALARAVGVKPPTVDGWCKGERPVPPAKCVLIERATKGQVGRIHIIPNGFADIWPELSVTTEAA